MSIFGDPVGADTEPTEYSGDPGTNSLPLRTTSADDRPPRYPAENGDHTPDDPGKQISN